MPPLDTGLDASSAHGAALAQVAPWPHARAFFCPTAFAHCRPFKPYCVTEAAAGFTRGGSFGRGIEGAAAYSLPSLASLQ